MKECEKELQNFISKQFCEDIIPLGRGYRAGWKDALEWARVKVENYTPEDVCYFIDEELGQ